MTSFDDRTLAQVLRGSQLLAAIDGMMRRLHMIVATSQTAQAWTAAQAEWRRHPIGDRRRAIAIMLLVAVTVYVASVVLRGDMRGWLWTLIPGTTAAAAGLLWIFSGRSHPA